MTEDEMVGWHHLLNGHAATAAKSLQSCLTLCDPMNGSPPGSSIPGILQARTLEWDAISFSDKNTLLFIKSKMPPIIRFLNQERKKNSAN